MMRRLEFQREQPSLRRSMKRAIRNITGYEFSRHINRVRDESAAYALLPSLSAKGQKEAIQLDYGVFDPTQGELHVVHDSGLYSCLTVTLWCLADLLREGHVTRKINFTHTLKAYKDVAEQDIFPVLFSSEIDDAGLERIGRMDHAPWRRFDHHGEYRKLFSPSLKSLVDIYFKPSRAVLEQTSKTAEKYVQADKRYVGVCFRGTDKATEVMPIDSAVYLELAERLLIEKRVDRILIQTDQEQVSRLFQNYFGDVCDLIEKLPRTRGAVAIHNGTVIDGARLGFALDMISAVRILARMDQVIAYTGNVGAWIALGRDSSRGFWQAMPTGISPQWEDASNGAL